MELTFRGVLCERLVERKVEQKDATEGTEEAAATPPAGPETSGLAGVAGLADHPSNIGRTGKLTKKESKRIAAGNGKVSSWLRNITREKEEEKIASNTRRMEREIIEDMEWTATPDPGVELAKNNRLREAAFRKQKEINKYVIGNVVKDIVETIIPLSMSANIIDILISRSVRQGKAGVI